MIAVLCKNLVKKENQASFLAAAKEHAEISLRTDAGCVRFDVLMPLENSDEIIFAEIWEERACLDAHALRGKTAPQIALLNSLRYDKDMQVYNLF